METTIISLYRVYRGLGLSANTGPLFGGSPYPKDCSIWVYTGAREPRSMEINLHVVIVLL